MDAMSTHWLIFNSHHVGVTVTGPTFPLDLPCGGLTLLHGGYVCLSVSSTKTGTPSCHFHGPCTAQRQHAECVLTWRGAGDVQECGLWTGIP